MHRSALGSGAGGDQGLSGMAYRDSLLLREPGDRKTKTSVSRTRERTPAAQRSTRQDTHTAHSTARESPRAPRMAPCKLPPVSAIQKPSPCVGLVSRWTRWGWGGATRQGPSYFHTAIEGQGPRRQDWDRSKTAPWGLQVMGVALFFLTFGIKEGEE